MKAPAWVRRITRPRRTSPGTVEVTITADVSQFVEAMGEAAEGIRRSRYRARIRHERSLGLAYVGVQLDDLARSVGMDPVQAWRLPRAADERLTGLTDPDRTTRQAAEAAWLASARAHQAEQAAARRAVGDA